MSRAETNEDVRMCLPTDEDLGLCVLNFIARRSH